VLHGRKIKSGYKNVPKNQTSLYNEIRKFGVDSIGDKSVKLEETSDYIQYNANKSIYAFDAVFSKQCKNDQLNNQVIKGFMFQLNNHRLIIFSVFLQNG